MDLSLRVRSAILEKLAATGTAPTPAEVAQRLGEAEQPILASWRRLRDTRAIVTGEDGTSILMANPFSGIPTEHIFESEGVRYYANCGWDALGIPAALGRTGIVRSRCANSGEPLELEIGNEGPEPCDWLFHSLVPAARWWDDIVFT